MRTVRIEEATRESPATWPAMKVELLVMSYYLAETPWVPDSDSRKRFVGELIRAGYVEWKLFEGRRWLAATGKGVALVEHLCREAARPMQCQWGVMGRRDP